MPRYRNTDTQRRVWPSLQDPGTGRTLELDPGEEVVADFGDDLTDTYLQPVATSKKPTSKTPSTESDTAATQE